MFVARANNVSAYKTCMPLIYLLQTHFFFQIIQFISTYLFKNNVISNNISGGGISLSVVCEFSMQCAENMFGVVVMVRCHIFEHMEANDGLHQLMKHAQ